MGFLNGSLIKSHKIRSVVHTGSRYFHVLFYDIKHTSYTPLVIFFKLYFLSREPVWCQKPIGLQSDVIVPPLYGGAPQHKEENCWIVIIFVFFAHKRKYCSFVKIQLNHWCHMDNFTDVLAMFLDLDRGSNLAVYAGSESSLIFINNILICVPKMNGSLTGLELHE